MANQLIEELKRQFRNSPVLHRLIAINLIVFFAIHIIGTILFFFEVKNGVSWIVYWLSTPADLSTLASKPWTIFTYMFLHEGFWHIFMNMLVLYFGGQIFLQFLNSKRLVGVYILGGLSGIFLYILSFNLLPVFSNLLPNSVALGASASVMAILIAGATYVPNMVVRLMFFGNVKLKYIAMAYVLIDIISIKGGNSGGHIAHLGGALFGYVFVLQLRKGKDLTNFVSKFLSYCTSLFKPKNKLKVVYNRSKAASDYDFNAERKAKQERVDAILDKISKSGYDSLTGEEKAILFDASKK